MKSQIRIKLTSHTGIAAAVPYLIGFIPTDSLVVIGLQGERDRMTFTMRLDLPAPEDRAYVVSDTAVRMRVAGCDRVLFVVYTDEPFIYPKLPEVALVNALEEVLEAREALLVQGDRVWSYLCDDTNCCPPEGRTYLDGADATNVAAAHVLYGRSGLMTRDQLIATVAAPSAAAAAPVLKALPLARQELVGLSAGELVGRLGRLLAVCLARLDDPRAELHSVEVAEFIALLDDVRVRDVLLRRIANTDDTAMQLSVAELARRTPASEDAQVATVLAAAAYLAGDGVVCRAALERALATDPTHCLAAVMSTMLDDAVHPKVLRQALTAPMNSA